MYRKFYGLKEKPFNVTSDPAFFFFSQQHREALSHLAYGVANHSGVIVITGEIGTGKTTLCRFFLSQLGRKVKTAFVLNPYFSDAELFEAILTDFGIRVKDKTHLSFVLELNSFLIRQARRGRNVVLIIDESQNLKPSQLEQIRLLSNLETEKTKLIQIVLVGQPELRERLNLYELRQLNQRVALRQHIGALRNGEVRDYILHRLCVSGSVNAVSFTDEAFSAIAEFSAGTPRLINIICDRALLAGFVSETKILDINIINRCLEELSSYHLRGAKI